MSPDLLQEDAKLTQIAFTRLLVWLDDGIESHGERYLDMRRRLVSYFDRRNRPSPDELADETFNRIARTLDEAGVIETKPPARYCYVVAKFVLLEDLRRERRHVVLDESRLTNGVRSGRGDFDDERAERERRLDCLDRCLEDLKPEQRALIVEYYAESRQKKIERRRSIAKRLGISMNALAIRAWRIREGLLTCVQNCGGRQEPSLHPRHDQQLS
ncbi:MAG TPA: hypothetical protein VKD69_26985 [Vicinamibacterales bacterium]|nr:hypothetical protein [Vicinamibacterales bacterium]